MNSVQNNNTIKTPTLLRSLNAGSVTLFLTSGAIGVAIPLAGFVAYILGVPLTEIEAFAKSSGSVWYAVYASYGIIASSLWMICRVGYEVYKNRHQTPLHNQG